MDAAKKKTVYLHIGSPKTGTSALQYFLLQNQQILSQKGFYYPTHNVDANRISSGNAKVLADFIKGDTEQGKSLISDIINTNLMNIILSSEQLYHTKDEKIGTLKDILGQMDIKIIIYLRRQDSMLSSLYQQRIKRFQSNVKMDVWLSENYQKHIPSNRIEKWAQVFGKENIIIRPYEQQQFKGGTIFSDFLDMFNLELTEEFVLPHEKINPAYRIDALEAMRLFNILPLTHYTLLLDILLQQFSSSYGKQGDWPYELMSPEKQMQICEYYDEHNARIARSYLGRQDGRLFYDPVPGPEQPWKPYPGLSKQAIRNIIAYIEEHDDIIFLEIAKVVTKGLHSDDVTVKQAAKTLSLGFKIFRRRYEILKEKTANILHSKVNVAG